MTSRLVLGDVSRAAEASEDPGPAPKTRACPKLRVDLVTSEQQTPEGVSFVVKDPAVGRFFRLRAPEYFIATQLDGKTGLEVIRCRAEERFGATLTGDSLAQFVERLGRLGLLETDSSRVEVRGHESPRIGAGGHGRGRVRGGPLALRVKVFDPDRLLGYLDTKLWFFFTPTFLVVSALAIVAAFGITITNADEMRRDLTRLWGVEALVLAWFMVFLVTTVHELAHGLACKRFGGEVHDIGFFLIYLQPAFYCNVSDAWLFPEKSKRLWVTFVGAYFELFLWALAALSWRVTESGTTVRYVALVVMATSGIKALFNWNPLIKLDGYYLLSDALGIPNLRKRAFAYLGASIKSAWGAAPAVDPAPTPRQRRIYVVYGVLAGAFSLLVLGWVAVQLGRFLFEQYQAFGFVLLTGLLALVFRHPLGRTAGKIPMLFKPGTWAGTSLKRRWKGFALLAASVIVVFLVRTELTISGEFKILPVRNADVRATVEGIVESVHADEGDVVAPGALIARLSARDYASELRKTEAELDEKQAKLKMLVAGPRREEIVLAQDALVTARTRVEHARKRYDEAERKRVERLSRTETSVEKARERFTYAQRLFDMHQSLFQKQLIALKQLIEAEEAVVVRKKELEEAQAELKLVQADDLAEPRTASAIAEKELREVEAKRNILQAGSRPEEIDATRAEVARLEAQRRQRAEQLQLLTVTSPLAGVVITPKLREKVGRYLNKGDLIAEVQELRTVTAQIAVPEGEIGDVKVGQPVVLKTRAYPERSFRGTVSAIGAAATKEDGRSIVNVSTVIDNADNKLKAELTGNAKIHADRRPLFDLMMRRLARYIRVEFWSWW